MFASYRFNAHCLAFRGVKTALENSLVRTVHAWLTRCMGSYAVLDSVSKDHTRDVHMRSSDVDIDVDI
jgi:hypothetical protein